MNRRLALVGVAALGLAAMIVLLVTGGESKNFGSINGLPDPGALTNWGIPVLNVIGEGLMVAMAGALLVPLLGSDAVRNDLKGVGARAVRTSGRLALVFAVVEFAQGILGASNQFAVPFWHVGWSDTSSFLFSSDLGRSYVAETVIGLLLAGVSRFIVTVAESCWLLALSLTTVVPIALTGHSSTGGSHDTAIVSLFFHLAGVVLWVGGVVALWWYMRVAKEERLARAARRFSRVATWAFGTVAVSGVINAAVRLGSWHALGSGYGVGIIAKTVALVVLGLIAARTRRWVNLAKPGSVKALALLTGLELTVMSVAIGLGVALSRTPPPIGTPYTSVAQDLLGGPLPPAPTAARLLWTFTGSGVGFAVLFFGIAGYAVGVITLARRGVRWPVGKSVLWGVGILVVSYATLGGLGRYSHVMFSWHMVSHMALSQVAPIFLVLGDPVGLALRALPGPDVPGASGPRQWLAWVLRSWYVRFFSHPIIAWVVFVGSLYAIYFTGAFDHLMQSHLGHAFMQVHFLVAGCLFFEVILGHAPLPNRPTHLARVMMVLLTLPFHSFFAIALMNSTTLVGGYYWLTINAPYVNLLHDQNVAGGLTWAMSDIPMLIVAIAIVGQWFRSDQREAKNHDRREAASGDAELEAYNAMLAERSAAWDTEHHDR